MSPTESSAGPPNDGEQDARTPADGLGCAAEGGSCAARWGKRVGAFGFLFFLIKGLLWLLIPALVLAWQWMRSL